MPIPGTQYPNGIRTTALDAVCLDYAATVVTDACPAQTDAVAEANVADMAAVGVRCLREREYRALSG